MDEAWQLKPKIERLLIASDHAGSIHALAQCLDQSARIVGSPLVFSKRTYARYNRCQP